MNNLRAWAEMGPGLRPGAGRGARSPSKKRVQGLIVPAGVLGAEPLEQAAEAVHGLGGVFFGAEGGQAEEALAVLAEAAAGRPDDCAAAEKIKEKVP